MKLNWDKILKYIPSEKRDEVKEAILKDYQDIVTTNHPVTWHDGDSLRFKRKKLVRWLVDQMNNLNTLAIAANRKDFPLKEYQQFYKDLGYSLSGFCEVFIRMNGMDKGE